MRGRHHNPTRDAARLLGDRTFTADEPCICGATEFYVSSGRCIDCTIAAAMKRYSNQTPADRAHRAAADAARYKRRAQ